jgi:uncharacterized protein YjgD (DUF1641 family)
MREDLTILIDKIDQLSTMVEEQGKQISALENSQNNGKPLYQKIDLLIEHNDRQLAKEREAEELKNDLLPIANQMIKLTIDELADIGSDFQIEDLLFLLKRLLRDTQLLVGLLDRLESSVELFDEIGVIGQQVFNQAVFQLDEMERKGYFAFAREGMNVFDRVVTEFSEEDVKALGDNIVTILTTVKNLTQPEIMELTNNALNAATETEITDEDISIFRLMKDLSDPQVRKGMARLINIVKALADQPVTKQKNTQ